jgi:hypothetical protein
MKYGLSINSFAPLARRCSTSSRRRPTGCARSTHLRRILGAYAAYYNVSRTFRRLLRFAYLAPDIVEAIIEGRQARSLTVKLLLRGIRFRIPLKRAPPTRADLCN